MMNLQEEIKRSQKLMGISESLVNVTRIDLEVGDLVSVIEDEENDDPRLYTGEEGIITNILFTGGEKLYVVKILDDLEYENKIKTLKLNRKNLKLAKKSKFRIGDTVTPDETEIGKYDELRAYIGENGKIIGVDVYDKPDFMGHTIPLRYRVKIKNPTGRNSLRLFEPNELKKV